MTAAAIRLDVILVTETCVNCGVPFAIPDYMQKRLIQNQGTSFYCPSGHQQHYTGKTETQRLREQLNAQLQESTRQAENAKIERAARERAEAELARHKKRSAAGTCPCCKRTFQELTRHMQTKHPEYVAAHQSAKG